MKKAVSHRHDFTKKGKVSIWVSQYPYADIPDDYFEEALSRNNTRATNTWSDNFNLKFFNPEKIETNGSHGGTISIEKAAGECSFSCSFIDILMSKVRQKKLEQITWIVLLFEYKYSPKISKVVSDSYLTFIGAFDYDDDAVSLYEIE